MAPVLYICVNKKKKLAEESETKMKPCICAKIYWKVYVGEECSVVFYDIIFFLLYYLHFVYLW